MSHRRNLARHSIPWTQRRQGTIWGIAMDKTRVTVTKSWTNPRTSRSLKVCSTVDTNSTTITHLISWTPSTFWIWSALYFVVVPARNLPLSQLKINCLFISYTQGRLECNVLKYSYSGRLKKRAFSDPCTLNFSLLCTLKKYVKAHMAAYYAKWHNSNSILSKFWSYFQYLSFSASYISVRKIPHGTLSFVYGNLIGPIQTPHASPI